MTSLIFGRDVARDQGYPMLTVRLYAEEFGMLLSDDRPCCGRPWLSLQFTRKAVFAAMGVLIPCQDLN